MPQNTRFAVAIHTAGMLAHSECMPVSSESIALSVNTNPVVVRRIVGLLTKYGLVTVRKGQGGGAILTRPANKITLAEIYRAVEPGPLFQIPNHAGSRKCVIGRHVGPILSRFMQRAEKALLDKLEQMTLADVISAVEKKVSKQGCK